MRRAASNTRAWAGLGLPSTLKNANRWNRGGTGFPSGSGAERRRPTRVSVRESGRLTISAAAAGIGFPRLVRARSSPIPTAVPPAATATEPSRKRRRFSISVSRGEVTGPLMSAVPNVEHEADPVGMQPHVLIFDVPSGHGRADEQAHLVIAGTGDADVVSVVRSHVPRDHRPLPRVVVRLALM